jgi:hypothetical protein
MNGRAYLSDPTLTYNQKDISFSLGLLAQVVGNPKEKGDLNVSHASPLEIRVKLRLRILI